MSHLAFALVVVASVVGQPPPEYFYGDYDNVVVTAKDTIYVTSALTPEAVKRTGQGSSTVWSSPKKITLYNVNNAKGAAFCAERHPLGPEGGKHSMLFIADEGTADEPGLVMGYNVHADPVDPAAIQLSDKWDVSVGFGSKPSDVECGPNNGLFIADNGAIYWVSGRDLVAKKSDARVSIVPKECGGAVGAVRSLVHDAAKNRLSWTNNDEVNVANAGVFLIELPADNIAAPVPVTDCAAANCDVWSQNCSTKIKKVVSVAQGEKAWAVADAWGSQQVSKGGNEVFNWMGEKILEVPQQATYAEATNDERDVLFVADQIEGAIFVAPQSASAKKIADVANAFGVAFNNAFGHTESPRPNSTSSESCKDATVTCSGALAKCISTSSDPCPCYAAYIACLKDISAGVCQESAESESNIAAAEKSCVDFCTSARCTAPTTQGTAGTMSSAIELSRACKDATLSCSAKLADCVRSSADPCPCYAANSGCLEDANEGVCELSAQSAANAMGSKKVCVDFCTAAKCDAASMSALTGSLVVAVLVGVFGGV